MFDQIFDRTYQAGREDLHEGLDKVIRRVANATGDTFRALHRIEFDAPWKERSDGARCA